MPRAATARLDTIEKILSITLSVLALLSAVAKLPGVRESSTAFFFLSRFFVDCLVALVIFLALRSFYRRAARTALLARVRNTLRETQGGRRLLYAMAYGLVVLLASGSVWTCYEVAAMRVSHYGELAEGASSARLYLAAVRRDRDGMLERARELYDLSSERPFREVIGEQARRRSRELSFVLRRSTGLYGKAQGRERRPGSILYDYWHLADALSLDRSNALYQRELTEMHQEVSSLIGEITAQSARSSCRDSRAGIGALVTDPRYESIVGRTVRDALLEESRAAATGTRPFTEALCSTPARDLDERLRERAWFPEIDSLLKNTS